MLMSLSGGGTAGAKLSELREAMAAADVAAFVVPSGDPHLSEYVHPAYERRAFISGFTGSAGTAVVTADSALLWTDGRYFMQAEQELSDEWTLMKAGQPGVPKVEAWIADNLPEKAKLGIDPSVHSVEQATAFTTALEGAKRGLSLEPLSGANLVDRVWEAADGGRPSLPQGAARALPVSVSGKPSGEKLAAVAATLAERESAALLVGSLDEVCWLFNLRGDDVPHCPVLQAYALVHANGADTPSATLFVDEAKLTDEVRDELKAAGVTTRAYGEVEAAVAEMATAGARLSLDPTSVNYALRMAAGEKALLSPSPLMMPKAIKNDAEVAGMVEAHAKDGAALASFFGWLQRTIIDEQV